MRKLCVTLGMQDQTSGSLHRYFEFRLWQECVVVIQLVKYWESPWRMGVLLSACCCIVLWLVWNVETAEGKYRQVNWPGNCSGSKWICSVLSHLYRDMKIFAVSTVGSQCSGLEPVMITHFSSNVLTFCDWFLEIGMWPSGSWIVFPHTLSSLRPRLLSSEVSWFFTLWDDTVSQAFKVLRASQSLCFIKK